MNKYYNQEFYERRHKETIYSANAILSFVIDLLPTCQSAVDFGCGVGTWLAVLKENGVQEVLGLEGPWLNEDYLEISREEFQFTNFEDKVSLDKKYDLAISLEVAEHLKSEVAECFVESLTSASDIVLFSAAIPLQGGKDHVNEQWPTYWQNLFADHDYVVVDLLRNKIWNDQKIPPWYRQNILMFVKKNVLDEIHLSNYREYDSPINIVHPDIYLPKIQQTLSLKGSFKLFLQALKQTVIN